MTLEEIMGSNYKEGMTAEDVKAYFKSEVLSSGEYENKEKSSSEKKNLQSQIDTLKNQLKDKMSDEDKKKANDAEMQKAIEALKNQLLESNKKLSKSNVIASLEESRTRLGIKSDDKDFDEFISTISFEDNDKASKTSKYISSLISKAYENGKTDTMKNKLGNMGAFKEGSENPSNEAGSFGKQLAQNSTVNTANKKNYFERN